MAAYVLDFQDTDATSLPLAGGKGANLGELARIAEIRVPEGFCVTTAAYADVVGRDEAFAARLDELSRVTVDDSESVRQLAARVRDAVERIPIPAQLAEEVRAALARIGPDVAFAVRSSATAEDLPTASFAGQQDTYLNVTGADAVLAHIRRCWASLFTDRAVTYRLQEGIDHRSVQLAVVVQRMVFPEAAGILFTADPITSNRTVASIDAGLGLGEALVSGLVNADNYKVRGDEIVARTISTQDVAIRAVPGGGTEQVPVEATRGRAQKLSDTQILRLAELGRRIEAHFGRPQDVEWSLADDVFYIVQSRPITTLFPVPAESDGKNHVYASLSHQQMMTDAMTPLGMSFFGVTFDGVLVEAGGRLYGDLAPYLASPLGRRVVLASLGKIDPLMLTAVRRLVQRTEFMQNLARDGRRLFSMKGTRSGYFTWRLPVETVKAYRRDDPSILDRLKKQNDAALAAARARIEPLTGDAVFDCIVEDLQQLQKAVYEPRGMAAIYVGMYALSWLNRRMAKWLGEKGAGDALAQSAQGDISSAMGLALLDVADVVRNHPDVQAALRQADGGDLFARLKAVDGGADVARAIEAYLQEYGVRCPGEIDVTRTRWNEDPAQLVPLILSNIAQFGPGAHAEMVERGLRRAEERKRSLLERLARSPRGRRKVEKTRRMISRMHHFVGHREYPKYLMMQRYWVLKQAMLREAASLVRDGVIEREDDVYFLSFEEFREAVRTRRVDHSAITERRAEFAVFQKLTPPRIMTSDGEVVTGEYDSDTIPQGALAGIPASSGVVEGRARVVLSLDDARFEDGDILVTRFTDPSWTPAFLSVKALVTEVGGMMTHGAVVAREYGLPAVVGAEGATTLLADGQRIRVNGTEGYVEHV